MMWKWSELKELLKKSDYTETAVVVWPVVYPSDLLPPEDPHVTILYLGDIAGLNKADIISAIKETESEVFLWVNPIGVELFGPEQNVPVLRVEHSYLYKYHDALTSALAKRDIHSASEFSYKPYITLSESAVANDVIPTNQILLLPVELWWGDTKIEIKSGGPLKVSL